MFDGGHRLSSITVNWAAVGDGDLNVPPAEVIPQPDGTLLVRVTGAGSAAVLGAFDFATVYIVDPQVGAIPRGEAVFHFDHGDLYLTFAGTFDQNNNFTGTYRITGGTGAYQGVSGAGVNLGRISADLTFRVTFDGTLIYP